MSEPNFEGHLDRECELPAVRAELARWKNLYTEAASIINWSTTCASCARLLDRSYDDYCKLEELTAERDAALAKIAAIQAVADSYYIHPHCSVSTLHNRLTLALAGRPEDRNNE